LSDAEAERGTLPLSVWPDDGAVMLTIGGVMSVGGSRVMVVDLEDPFSDAVMVAV
jgi:hypothetical protein